mmetsp:Transcript_15325/g.39049  ORF Transcript_15325/g.39049 Transcript_15325/m.39049 type:complete len:131 (+) Transcript_15325:43-435(+)
MAHTSQKAVDTTAIASSAERNYAIVGEVIKAFGKPNPKFPCDFDLEYGVILEKTTNRVSGLGTLLKNMKQKKMLDFPNVLLQNNTVVTLITDYYQELVPQCVRYEEIRTSIKGEETSHQRGNYNQYEEAA